MRVQFNDRFLLLRSKRARVSRLPFFVAGLPQAAKKCPYVLLRSRFIRPECGFEVIRSRATLFPWTQNRHVEKGFIGHTRARSSSPGKCRAAVRVSQLPDFCTDRRTLMDDNLFVVSTSCLPICTSHAQRDKVKTLDAVCVFAICTIAAPSDRGIFNWLSGLQRIQQRDRIQTHHA